MGLPPSFLLSCFISGLASDVRREVQALQPLSLIEVAALARLQEEKLHEARRSARNKGILLTSVASHNRFPNNPKPPVPHFKRLTPTEMSLRREKGLCFNCDEKFSPGHKCVSNSFVLIMEEDEPQETNTILNPCESKLLLEPEPNLTLNQAQISFHALLGHLAPETLRLVGRISTHNAVILVDGGSTHNFIQERLVKSLGLKAQSTCSLKVMVGNGNEIECHQICPQVKIHIQSHTFTVDLHVLPLSGADIVLGVQWIKSLGPILTDYNDLSMKFLKNGKMIELRGERDGGLHLITA